jgi:formiminotetrahydrofolate cyclodeaminase
MTTSTNDGQASSGGGFETMTLRSFLDVLAAKAPTPGGGAAASVVGAVAASLAGMVVNYSLGKKALSQHQATLEDAIKRLHNASELMLRLADEDAAAYGAVNELSKLPENDPRRVKELPAAQAASGQIPLAVMAACVDLLMLMDELAGITNKQLRSDLGIAAVAAEGAGRGSWWNVYINASFLADEEVKRAWMTEADTMKAKCVQIAEKVEMACR